MDKVLAFHDRHCSGHTYAVVGSQGGAHSIEVVLFDLKLQGVLAEIMLNIGVLLADHIHVGLEHNDRRAFLPCGGRLFDQDVPNIICEYLKGIVPCELLQMVGYNLLVLRAAGYPAYVIKMLP